MVQDGEVMPSGSTPLSADDRYALLRRRLERAVRKICPAWLADQSEDLVHEALLSLMRREERSEEKPDFSQSYLMRTAYSKVVDEIRRQRVRRQVPLEEGPEEEPSFPDPAPDPHEELRRRQLGRAIHECLERLIRPRRLAVTLYLQGHRAKETARLLGWDKKRTENLIYRGREDLQDCLEEKGFRR
jgi:RNA polymerase sigma-70 factor (ECF subfamily)